MSQKAVAERAEVTKYMVCHVLAGRYVSAPVVRAAKALLAEAKETPPPPPHPTGKRNRLLFKHGASVEVAGRV